MNGVQRVIEALDDVAATSLVWRGGLLHRGGPHRRLAGMFTPICIGEDECAVFGRLVEAFRPRHAFVIGNAFGVSSCAIAAAMEAHGGERVVAMDSHGEGDGAACAAVADALAQRMGLSILENRKGLSPDDTAAAVPNDVLDLVFIDGEHRHPAVTRDFEGVLPFTDEHTVVVWHDYWLPGIAECVRTATEQGFRCWWVPTSCEMVVGTRDPQRFATITGLFPRGVENRRRPFPLTPYILMGAEIAKFRLGRLLRRGARFPSGRR